MKALVYTDRNKRPLKIAPSRKSGSHRPMPSSKSSRPRFAAPICISSKVTWPTCTPGRILGHEGVGVVDKIGACVSLRFGAGDHVIVSCISACGKCDYCLPRHVFALRQWRLDSR